MQPPLFAILSKDADIKHVFGNEIRVYPFGEAITESGKPPAPPYAVWQVISGNPENYLAHRPDIDSISTQFDIYAKTGKEALQAAQALRHALELDCYITSIRNFGIDADTQLKRFSFDADWLVER